MKRGLVIGKFLPVHKGHVALIEFAASRCDELYVSMSETKEDPIPATLRLEWLKKIFAGRPEVKLFSITDNFDDPSLPLLSRTKIWAEVMARFYPPFDFLFSSEAYGDPFAFHLGAQHIPFDYHRKQFPVSASRVRTQPFRYWEFIPDVVRPYFVKRVCFFGPESTGKTTLARKMAERYHTDWVPEVAREMLITNTFSVDDILRIGRAQTERVLEKTNTANRILFCDTDLITTQIYSYVYLHQVPAELFTLEAQVRYDLYFLLDIDVPWIPDGLRDLGDRREEMKRDFITALEQRNIPYVLVSGSFEQREKCICETIEKRFFGWL